MKISVDIHCELTDSVSELEYFLSVKNVEISLYAQAQQSQPSTFNPRQYLQSLEIPKQISYVLRGIKRAISRKLVKISDCRVSSFLKTFPGCRVSRHEQRGKALINHLAIVSCINCKIKKLQSRSQTTPLIPVQNMLPVDSVDALRDGNSIAGRATFE